MPRVATDRLPEPRMTATDIIVGPDPDDPARAGVFGAMSLGRFSNRAVAIMFLNAEEAALVCAMHTFGQPHRDAVGLTSVLAEDPSEFLKVISLSKRELQENTCFERGKVFSADYPVIPVAL